MIDIKLLRENPEIVKENIRKKFQDEKLSLVDEVIALDAECRRYQQEGDDLRAKRNKISKEIGVLMSQGKGKRRPQKKRKWQQEPRDWRNWKKWARCCRKRSTR